MTDEQHTNLKIPLTLQDIRMIWSDQGYKVRIEMIKSIIYTSPDIYDFYEKVMEELKSDKFLETFD